MVEEIDGIGDQLPVKPYSIIEVKLVQVMGKNMTFPDLMTAGYSEFSSL